MARKLGWLLAAVVAVGGRSGLAQTTEKAGDGGGYQMLPHSDSFFAEELLRLHQVDVIAAEAETAKGLPAENLWKAQRIVGRWEEIAKNRSELPGVTQEYLGEIHAYMASQTAGIDGVWALDHVKFIFARLSEPVINRMEYWGASARDRAALRPMAETAEMLLKQAAVSVEAGSKYAEAQTPFNEPLYMRNYNAMAEVEYYGAWTRYFQAMGMDPVAEGKGRLELLRGAIELLKKWADDAEDNGVNNQALLLRGKARIEAGDTGNAIADLAKGDNAKAPEWVRYQARYQTVVAYLRGGDFVKAYAQLETFKKTLSRENVEAQLNADMLGYRIAWAEAEKKNGVEQKNARLGALGILEGIIQRDPRFRQLVFEQLTAQLPDDVNMADLLPLQQLAIAYTKSQGQKGDTPESRKLLMDAVNASLAVRGNGAATATEKLEATFLAGVCDALLNNLVDAARYNIEFAEASPKDPRAKTLTDLALQQIGELRKIAGAENISPDVRALQERALVLATGAFHDERWLFAQARALEDSGKIADAAALYEEVAEGDKNYLDARYHLVMIAAEQFSQAAAGGKGAPEEVRSAADELFKACARYVRILDNPPAGAQKEAVERAKTYRVDIWLIETATALDPVVKQPEIALDRLAKLEAIKAQLTPTQQGAVLRYRIQAYQLAGDADKALQVVKDYAVAEGKDATAVIQGMAYATLQDIDKAEKDDPAHARDLARFMSQLLGSLIKSAEQDAKVRESVYDYEKLQSDMLLRAGEYKEAEGLALKLQEKQPGDLFNYMTQARATFEEAAATNDAKAYAVAEDLFTRILPKVTNGSDSYWECWLRIIQTKEAIGGKDGLEVIRKRMADLKAGFGDRIGGEAFKAEFVQLSAKYGM